MAVKYWVGGGSSTNWDATGNTNWSLTDGGANDAAVPAAGDDVFIKSASNCVINANTAYLKSFDMTGYTGTLSGTSVLTVRPATGNTVVCIFGGTVTWTGVLTLDPQGTAIINFTSNGVNFGNTLYSGYWGAVTGAVNQLDAITMAANKYINISGAGTWNTNGYSITCFYLKNTGAAERTFNFTNSTISCTWDSDNSIAWYLKDATNLTLISTGSTINILGAAQFEGNSQSYNIVTFSGDDSTIVGDNTFNTLNVNTAGFDIGLKFTVDSIQTVTNFTTNGYASNLAKILSTSAGSAFTLTTASDQISVDYMSIKDSVADEATTWYAGANSTDVSGNSGWVFTTPPPEQGSTNLVCRLNIDYADTSTNLVCRINVYYIINTKNLVCQIDCVELISDWVEYTTPLNKNWRYIQIKIATS